MLSVNLRDRAYSWYRRRTQETTPGVLWLGEVNYGGVRGALGLRESDGRYCMYRHHLDPLQLDTAMVMEAIERSEG